MKLTSGQKTAIILKEENLIDYCNPIKPSKRQEFKETNIYRLTYMDEAWRLGRKMMKVTHSESIEGSVKMELLVNQLSFIYGKLINIDERADKFFKAWMRNYKKYTDYSEADDIYTYDE